MSETNEKGPSQLFASKRIATDLKNRNGEDRNQETPFSQRQSAIQLTPQALANTRFNKLWLLAVICGCLGLFGIGRSTVSAHCPTVACGEFWHLPAFLAIGAIGWCRRRDDEDDDDDGDGEDVEPGAASYSRYSSESQDDRSIGDQQRKCRDRAAAEGLEILPALEFSDEAVSGAKHQRAGFDAMMKAARTGRIDVVYFENLSRLARDCVLTLQTLRELVHRLKIRIVSLDEGIDSAASDSWELLAAVLGIQNEQFLRSLAKFVFRGQEGLVLDQLCVGDYCFGYDSEPIPDSEKQRRGRHPKPKMRYIIDLEHATWVQRIFHWYVVELRSLRWIAAKLNELGAPKDHRSSTPHWHHQLVSALLKRTKYIGQWPWGISKNVRDPSTGKVHQEKRSPTETDKWMRDFPHLRIIDDETFAKAQERLQASAAAVAVRTKKDEHGRKKKVLAGATKQTAETWPRHLLAGLIECGHCGRRLYVGGGSGKYLFCPGYRMGVCPCQTSLQRDRAETMILDAIGAKVLEDQELLDAMLNAARRAWDELERQLPSERAATEKGLKDVDSRIARLVDQCEREDMPELSERLQARRAERRALQTMLERLENAAGKHSAPPDKEWMRAQLTDLKAVLTTAGPAAAIALRQLVGGRIVVTEIQRAGKTRHYLRGELRVQFRDFATALGVGVDRVREGSAEEPATVMNVDFWEPVEFEKLADAAKEDFDAGMTFVEIGVKHDCSKQLASRAFAHWHQVRSLPVPDARSLRARLQQPKQVDRVLQAKAMELWRQELLLGEIAQTLGRRRDVIHAVVAAWHEERGIPLPDGRTRRRDIRLRKEQRQKDAKAG